MIDNVINKVYFQPGDIVTLKQEIPNKPTMIVVKKKTLTIRPKDGDKTDFLQGIICRWFTINQELQEAVFNTKDLIKI
jgi:uncharacterized protein YodC (DUF2158 family)